MLMPNRQNLTTTTGNDFSKEQCSSLRMILGLKHVGAILKVLM